jgi:predicted O-methyltransferase YrrM
MEKFFLKDWLALEISKYKLRKHFRETAIADIIQTTKSYVGYGHYNRISMSQKNEEITGLANLVKGLSPEVILEIGTRKGGTLYTWSRFTNAKHIISIDLFGGIHGGGYHPKKQKFYRAFTSDSPHRKVSLIQNDSHAEETKNELIKILNGQSIDFLFIDGDHTYSGVKKDFTMYSSLVRKGGLIAFHDILENTQHHEDSSTIEVPKFWNEIRTRYESKEIVASYDQGTMGIGVLFV